MTLLQKQQITKLRTNGDSYDKIAESLNISKNTVKSYCQRNNLGSKPSHNNSKPKSKPAERVTHCRQCNQPLLQAKFKPKIFCNDKCRFAWWNGRRNNPAHIAFCARCNAKFNNRGKNNRKYCSHNCYVAARFGGVCIDQTAI